MLPTSMRPAGAPDLIFAARSGRNDGYWKRFHTLRSSPEAWLRALQETPASSRCDRSNTVARPLIRSYQHMPIISLTTDFGNADHFEGTMKGVMLGIAPRATIVDVTHEIATYEVTEAAFVIAQAWRYFPEGTIHVIVVDPGVGSARQPILAEAGGQFFVGPDNGVLSMIYEAAKHRVRVISNAKFMLDPVSRTFHGRDVFAPAAAHLAAGVAPARFGKKIDDYVRAAFLTPRKVMRGGWSGVVLK